MNKNSDSRLRRHTSGSPGGTACAGGERKRRGGVPEWAYRPVCYLLLAAIAVGLYAADAQLHGMNIRMIYAAAWLILARCLSAVLLPGTQSGGGDTYYNSIGRLRRIGPAGLLVTTLLLAGTAVLQLLPAALAFAALTWLAWSPRCGNQPPSVADHGRF